MGDLATDIQQNPYALPSALGLAAGTTLAARGGTVGTPLGIGLAGLGGYGLDYSSRRADAAAKQRLSDVLKSIKPGDPYSEVAQKVTGVGGTIEQSNSIYTEVNKPKHHYEQTKGIPGQVQQTFDSDAGEYSPAKGGLKIPEAEDKSFTAAAQRLFPNLSPVEAVKAYSAIRRPPEKADKPRYSLLYDPSGALHRVNEDTMDDTTFGGGLSKAAPKRVDPAAIISNELNKADTDWRAGVTAKTAGTSSFSKLFSGIKVDDPKQYGRLRVATALANNHTLPPDVAALDPKATLYRKAGKIQVGAHGSPVYRLSNGKFVETDAF